MAMRGVASSVPKERMLQYQDSLPSLPVPPLEQTCRKYLESGTLQTRSVHNRFGGIQDLAIFGGGMRESS